MPKKIDDRINEILTENGACASIDRWCWHGCPGPFSDNANVPFELDMKVYLEIMRSPVEECIRSNSDYVRQCKSWIARKEELIKTNLM